MNGKKSEYYLIYDGEKLTLVVDTRKRRIGVRGYGAIYGR